MRISMKLPLIVLSTILMQFGGNALRAQEQSMQEQDSLKAQWKPDVDPASKARIKFIEDYWDFGSIPKETVVKHDFPFKNTGTDTLVFTRIKPTCGCTTVPLSSDRIAPGVTEELTAYLNTKTLHGSVRKSILIDTNDPVNPYLRISFSATIGDSLATIKSEPSVADFGSFSKDKNTKLELKITNLDTAPAELSVIDSPPPDVLAVSLGKKKLKAGESTTLGLEIAPGLDPGEFASSLTLEAAGGEKGRITIPVKGIVVE
jgi:hypothetical protein